MGRAWISGKPKQSRINQEIATSSFKIPRYGRTASRRQHDAAADHAANTNTAVECRTRALHHNLIIYAGLIDGART